MLYKIYFIKNDLPQELSPSNSLLFKMLGMIQKYSESLNVKDYYNQRHIVQILFQTLIREEKNIINIKLSVVYSSELSTMHPTTSMMKQL